MEKLRMGVVGASGWMAGALAIGAEYDEAGFDLETRRGRKSESSTVTALCDLNRAVVEQRKIELGLEQAHCFDSADELLAADFVDAVAIAVPNHLHADLAIRTLEAGKHLFLEKPFATTWEDAKRLAAASDQSTVSTKLDYIMMHYDEQLNLRKLVRQGSFGELSSVYFTYRHPIEVGQSEAQVWKLSREKTGGAMPMGVCHAISMTIFQIDSAPVEVICRSCPPKLRHFDYDTQVDLIILFESGVVGMVQGNIDFAEKYDARHTVIGTEGQFDYNPNNPRDARVMWSSRILGREYSADPGFAEHHLDSGDVWKHQCSSTIRAFVEHARQGQKDPLLGLESPLVRRTESVIWAAEQSAREGGRPVSISAFDL